MINSVIFIVVIIICLYLIFKALSRQGSNPNGFGAKFMLKRWAKKNNSLYEWAIKNTIVDDVHDILDLGIGSGTSSKALANHFKKAQVVGIDKSKDAVEYARTLNKEIIDRGQVGIIQGDVHQLGLKKNSFDLVYVFDNILYWEDLEKALSGIHVLMRDNASLIIAERIIYLNDDIQLLIEGLIKELGFNDFRVIEDEQFVMYQINK